MKNQHHSWQLPTLILCAFLGIFFSCETTDESNTIDDSILLRFENQLSKVPNIVKSSPFDALAQCDKVIKEAESINAYYYSGKAKWYKAYINDEITQNVSEAYFHYQESLKDLIKTDSSSLKMSVYTNIGVLYRFYGQYDAAIDSYEEALTFADDLSPKQLSDLFYNYGVALKLKGDDASFLEAEKAFTRSLELAQKIDYFENIASVNNQIGLMYKAIEDYEMSRIAYQNTIRDFQDDKGMNEYVGKAYHGIGVTYMEEEKLEEAKAALKKALKFKRVSNSIFISKYDLGTVLSKSGDLAGAIDVWKDALNEKHDKNNIEQVQVYAQLTTALASNQQYKEAIDYSEIFNKNIQNILASGQKYKSENDKILFKDIVREYDEFSTAEDPFPSYWIILILSSMGLFLFYAFNMSGKLRSSKKVVQKMSEIQTKFQHLKVD